MPKKNVHIPISATIQAKLQQGLALHEQGRHAEAEKMFQEAIALKPDFAEAYNNRGVALKKLKRFEEALDSYDKAIALKPHFAEAHNNRGKALNALKLHQQALASCDTAIALKPDFAEAHTSRATALIALNRSEEAIASLDKAVTLKPDYAKAHYNRGVAFGDLKHSEEALASYDKAIALKPDFAAAHNNRGNALNDLERHEEAILSYDKAIALKPDYAKAYYNRGVAFAALKHHAEALASYDKAIALKPDLAEAYNNRAVALNALKFREQALASFDKANALKPDLEFLLGSLIHTKMEICDWSNLEDQIAHVADAIDRAAKVSLPFPLLAVTKSPELQRKAAEIYALAKHPQNNTLPKIAKHPRRNKICIGYFSADLRVHPVAILAAEFIEKHDRSRFEMIAISFGPDTKDEMQQRLVPAFDKFIDVRNQSDRDVALLARKLEIDIAVDLTGFTEGNRTDIFAMRTAPIQVNYLGYSGTMGTTYMDYLIADPTLIPAAYQKHYAEKIAYLPNSCIPNDSTRLISERVFDRAEFGLPQSGFVFCCFNNSYKLNPDNFDSWMRILKHVEGSVLWLSTNNATATRNLQREASIRGVNPERLVFASRMPVAADHLARHRLADLFLDTLPYNANTTASDALWAGLPVLTQVGETFIGRVAATRLNAIGLHELITSARQEYEAAAVELATNPAKLADIKRKLASNRLTSPLFDTQLFTKHIEAAYTSMYERYQAELSPDHIYVPQ